MSAENLLQQTDEDIAPKVHPMPALYQFYYKYKSQLKPKIGLVNASD